MTLTVEDINKREIYRYLGYRGQIPEKNVCAIVDEVLLNLLKRITPRYLYKVYSCQIQEGQVFLKSLDRQTQTCPDMVFQSRNLADNLKQCTYAVVFAATLGLEADKLLQKYEVLSMTKASVAQSCGGACIEAYCDKLQEKIMQEAQREGYYVRPRFSPGYGDFALEQQKDIFHELECTKRLGVTLTESLLMYPTKSVTAVIGITSNKQGCHIAKCSRCDNIECEFRNEF